MLNTHKVISATKNLSILFVEDDQNLRENTAEILKKFFRRVDSSHNGEDAIEKYIEYSELNSEYYDIVLSDLEMPILDGIELATHIYSINPSQNIIILSAFDDSEYLLSLINLGVNQFIKKPIDYQELLKAFLLTSQKIENSSSKKRPQLTNIPLSEEFIYDKESQSLLHLGKNVYLTKYEILLMQLLTTNSGKIYSNEEIVAHYSSVGESIDAKNIRKLVSKLRKKLPENCLESIYGIGYKIVPYYDA